MSADFTPEGLHDDLVAAGHIIPVGVQAFSDAVRCLNKCCASLMIMYRASLRRIWQHGCRFRLALIAKC
jgi:hypothetical protein